MIGLSGDRQDPLELFPLSIESFSQSKDPSKPEKNDDSWGSNSRTVVLSDGATNKSDTIWVGEPSGGQIASRIVTKTCLDSDLYDEQLVAEANAALAWFYESNGIDIQNPLDRIAASLLSVRISGEDLIITQVNNSGIRINGKIVYIQETICDLLHSHTRAEYIRLTGDINGSRDFILPLLQKQLSFQNNGNHKLGYGVIDGTETPRRFIRTYRIPFSIIDTLELFTDGYPTLPLGTTIDDWEKAFADVQRRDPNRCLDFPSTKPADDRTVLILRRN